MSKKTPLALFVAFFLILFITPPAPAQAGLRTGTLPQGFEWIEAGSLNYIPFGLKAGRSQQIWAASHIPGNGMPILLISNLLIRRDRRGLATPAFWVECEMGFSSSNSNPRTPSATFASNLNNDYLVVFPRQKLNIGATAASVGTGYQPWLPAITLNKPFLFNRSIMNNLLWEVKVFNCDVISPKTSFTMDGHTPFSMSLSPPKGISPAGCAVSKTSPPMTCSATIAMTKPAYSYNITIGNASPNLPVLITIGTSSTTTMGPVPLPMDLGPLGAPSCFVYTDMMLLVTTSADTAGKALLKVPLPPMNLLPKGFPIYSQGFAPTQAGMNPLGIAASNGAVSLLNQTLLTSLVFEATSPTATTGKVNMNNGIVLGIQFL